MVNERPSDSALPPRGASPLYDAAAMRQADAAASERLGLPSVILMERAGLGSAAVIMERWASLRKVTILVGKGNNGGDGYVVARHLAEVGWSVSTLAVDGPPATEDARTMATVAEALGLEAQPWTPTTPVPEGVIVDAMLGTGVAGAPRGAVAEVVEWISRAPGLVVSLDIPTGVDADTGVVAGAAIDADATITYHGDLVGLRVAPGRDHAGAVEVIDIGIPDAVHVEPAAWLTGPGTVATIPRRGDASDKYAAGAVLSVAGSSGLSGAACLTAEAVLRAGAGLSVAVVPEVIHAVCATAAPEVMFAASTGDVLGPQSLEEIVRQAQRVGAIVMGPGLGRASSTRALVGAVLETLDLPLVIDADALFHLAEIGVGGVDAAHVVLTPHAGEAARLLGVERSDVEAARLDSAARLAEISGAVCVLKGPGTIVATPAAAPIVNGVDAPALATAGTGDVLAGAIAACLAKGMPTRDAAAAGVALQGLAGTLVASEGATARDVLNALPAARGAG